MKNKFFAVCCALIWFVSSPLFAATKTTERQAEFGECRAYLQALAGALSGELAEYSTNTDDVLKSKFKSKDGTIRYTITCMANERKMVIQEETD